MKVGELVRKLQELGIEKQDLPVFRADIDYGPVPVTEVLEHPMYTYKDGYPPTSYHIDYFEFEDEDHNKMRGVQIL